MCSRSLEAYAGILGACWAFKKPVRSLLVVYMAGLMFTSFVSMPTPVLVGFWTFLIIFEKYLWYLAYSIIDRGNKSTSTFFTELFYLRPFWMRGILPLSKGAAYLQKVEAKNSLDLAKVQVKGLRLMIWAKAALYVPDVCNWAFGGQWDLLGLFPNGMFFSPDLNPNLNKVIEQYLQGKPFTRLECWIVLLLNFSRKVVSTTGWGGTIVAICRMMGFNILRNTYKPLYAKSIADFYNRFSFYFKELLVDFFFYPTYFRYFKKHPRVRIFLRL